MMSGAVMDYLTRRPENHITVASNILKDAEDLVKGKANCKAVLLDITNENSLRDLIKVHDLVLSMIPAVLQHHLAKPCLEEKKNLVTSSYTRPEMRAMEKEVEAAGILFLNECGLDPGIDHMTAKKVMDEAKAEGGKVLEFTSYCGGLVSPDNCENPFGYKFSWSPLGALRSLKNEATYLKDNQVVKVGKEDLLFATSDVQVNPAVHLEVYPNRDSLMYKELYNLEHAKTVIRGTFRFPGFPLLMRSASLIGLLETTDIEEGHKSTNWKSFLTKLVAGEDAQPKFITQEQVNSVIADVDIDAQANSELVTKISNRILKADSYKELSKEALTKYLHKVIKTFKWLGLFSESTGVSSEAKSYVEALCALLEPRLKLRPEEKDFIVMQHRFKIERSNGKTQTVVSNFLKIGEKDKTAMSACVGYTAAIAAQMVLDKKIVKKGVQIPITSDIYNPILAELAKDGIVATEEIE
jgi:saccharopine dehydrogenase (NADP+, L-glutamate forming)